MADAPTPEALAWLAGGKRRLVDALVACALAGGEVTLTGRKHFAEADGAAVTWSALSRKYEGRADALERRLCRDGQVMDADALRAVRRHALLPFAALGAIGAARLVYGIGVDRPVGFLLVLLLLTGTIALIRVATIGRHTLGGRETLARARAANDRLRRAPMLGETDLAVALFGTAVLGGSVHAGFHRFRGNAADGGSGGADGGGGDSGGGRGGCGGGGCGGCGGG